jgi:hypothetical protein
VIGWEGIFWTRQSPSTSWGDIPAQGNFPVSIWKLSQGDNHVLVYNCWLGQTSSICMKDRPMKHMLNKKHKMQVNEKVSNIRKHAKQGVEIRGYNKYLKKSKKNNGHIQTTHAVQTKTLDSF